MSTYPPNTTNPKKGSDKYLWNWLSSSLKKFAQALCPYLQDIGCAGGGGGGGFVEVTYTELQSLISSAGLTPGATYKITGFNKNSSYTGDLPDVLYDDGTNSGITIYMKAVSPDLMESTGYGEFYNPKYTGSAEYLNTDGTGLYQIWDGDNPDPLEVPAYGIGDIVYWGGYAWVNDTGNVGNAVSVTELSSDWDKLPYTATNYYELVTDEVSVDWNIGMIVGRRNAANKVSVQWTAEHWRWEAYYNNPPVNPVALVPWGLYSDVPNGDEQGIADLTIIDTTSDLINFKGTHAIANYFGGATYFGNNYFGKYTQLYENSFDLYSSFQNNTFLGCFFGYNQVHSDSSISSNIHLPGSSSYFGSNILKRNGRIVGNTIASPGVTIGYNVLENSSIQNNYIALNSYIITNHLSNASYIQGNDLDANSRIEANYLKNSSSIYDNSLDDGSLISYNHLENGCSIYEHYDITNGSQISHNIMTNNAEIYYNEMDTSYIRYNTMSNSSYIGELTMVSNGTIDYNTMDNSSYMESFNVENNSSITRNSMTNNSYMIRTNLDNGSQISSNTFNNSYMSNYNSLNSSTVTSNQFVNSSFQSNNLSASSNISENSFINGCSFYDNTMDGSSVYRNQLNYSEVYNNNLTNNSSIQQNELSDGYFYDNTLDSSGVRENTITGDSEVYNNNLTSSYMTGNVFTEDSEVYDNTLNNSSISGNPLSNSYISDNTLTGSNILNNTCNYETDISSNTLINNSGISYNTLSNNSNINSVSLDGSSITYNMMFNSSSLNLGTSGTLTGVNIQNNTIKSASVTDNISAATHIFASYSKDIFQREDSTVKLSYFNNSDVLTVVAVTA